MQRYTIERRQNNLLYERILRGLPCKYGPYLMFRVTVNTLRTGLLNCLNARFQGFNL